MCCKIARVASISWCIHNINPLLHGVEINNVANIVILAVRQCIALFNGDLTALHLQLQETWTHVLNALTCVCLYAHAIYM